ncbi:type II toxin-antitoxin system HipA family toxin [Derxia gummosa]|uniref:Type II toxin-antitoxin system HipA family toxin n=1 Tax=Derxia gummosa DSM 723 TaxID=1121388 RepID=A0A8B6X4U2_9BURK|nr:type II toxin-antitoxin system HipA family toxin [Derxia gummosa]
MGRPSRSRALAVWMNGERVGEWRLPAQGPMELAYDPDWLASPQSRPLSLSLPLNHDGVPLRGPAVEAWFDNLLPDGEPIRKRLQARFRTRGGSAFDLLEAVGRDCVGAVQLLAPDADPPDVRRIDAEPLDEAALAALIDRAVLPPSAWDAGADDGDFRLSLAGAQEKTAFTLHAGRWCRPHGATPTTHIFKLPLGLVGNRQADMRGSVENEWLCAELLRECGLDIARCEIARFADRKLLVVERFDRRLAASGDWWLRLPQEDGCQALGLPSARKYEADGGPGLDDLAGLLRYSSERERDLGTLLRAQLLFWLLAATDGHAKNFSLALLAGGQYRLTPLYDVLSAWPVAGRGANQLDPHRLKLAMALRGKNAHYRLSEIRRRHFIETAARCGYGAAAMEADIEAMRAALPAALDAVGARLPAGFPTEVFANIDAGTRGQLALL